MYNSGKYEVQKAIPSMLYCYELKNMPVVLEKFRIEC